MGSGPAKGRGHVMTIQCQSCQQVRGPDIPSGGLFIQPEGTEKDGGFEPSQAGIISIM